MEAENARLRAEVERLTAAAALKETPEQKLIKTLWAHHQTKDMTGIRNGELPSLDMTVAVADRGTSAMQFWKGDKLNKIAKTSGALASIFTPREMRPFVFFQKHPHRAEHIISYPTADPQHCIDSTKRWAEVTEAFVVDKLTTAQKGHARVLRFIASMWELPPILEGWHTELKSLPHTEEAREEVAKMVVDVCDAMIKDLETFGEQLADSSGRFMLTLRPPTEFGGPQLEIIWTETKLITAHTDVERNIRTIIRELEEKERSKTTREDKGKEADQAQHRGGRQGSAGNSGRMGAKASDRMGGNKARENKRSYGTAMEGGGSSNAGNAREETFEKGPPEGPKPRAGGWVDRGDGFTAEKWRIPMHELSAEGQERRKAADKKKDCNRWLAGNCTLTDCAFGHFLGKQGSDPTIFERRK